jgi:MFS family permease
MVPSSSTPQEIRLPFYISREYLLLWAGQMISGLGDYVFTTTLTLWIVTEIARDQPWAPLAVSGLLLAELLPSFLVGPLAGVFVDRWETRRVLLTMDLVRAILIALLIVWAEVVCCP